MCHALLAVLFVTLGLAILPKATKLAAVFGTMSPNTPITTLPAGLPPTVRSKNTLSVTVVVTLGSALQRALAISQKQLDAFKNAEKAAYCTY